VRIRLAVLTDASELARLHAGAFADGWSEGDFRVWLARPECFAMIAIRERDAVAFGLALAAGYDGELLTIATRPDLRREGLGRSIFGALDAEAKERGLGRWVLEVARNNDPALGLYKSAGFVEIGVRKAYYFQVESRADALVLSRPVGLAGGHGAA
jgi:ribosomal-protein-alanine N-acetyltransferase